MRKVKVSVELTARWTEMLEVELPDQSTEKEAEALVNQAIVKADDGMWPDTTEIERWEYEEKPVFSSPPPVAFPTDSKFIVRWQDGRWATTGVYAIREDVPCPEGEEEWIEKGEQLVQLLSNVQLTLERPSTMRFQERFAPILRSGRAMTARIEHVVGCAILHDDGRLKALVMPFRGGGRTVNCEGNP